MTHPGHDLYSPRILRTLAILTFLSNFVHGQGDSVKRPEIAPQLGHQVVIRQITFDPAGRWLASLSGEGIKIWDYAKGQELRTLPDYRVVKMAFNKDGSLLVTNSVDGLRLWEIPSGRLLNETKVKVDDLAFSSDGRLFARQSLEGQTNILDALSGEIIDHIRNEGSENISFLADTGCLSTTNGNILVLHCPGKSEIKVKFSIDTVNYMTVSPDRRFAAACTSNRVVILAIATGRIVTSQDSESCSNLIFSPDGKWLGSGDSSSFELWQFKNAQNSISLSLHLRLKGWRGDLFDFSPDSLYFAIRSDIAEMEVYGISSGKLVSTLKGADGWIVTAATSTDGHWLAFNSGRYVKIWDLQSGTLAKSIAFSAESVAFTQNGALAAEAFKSVKIYDAQTWRESMSFRVVEGGPIAASGDLIAFSDLAQITVVNFRTKKIMARFNGGGMFSGIAISPNSRLLATYIDNGIIKIWEIRSHKLIRKIPAAMSDDFEHPVTQIVFTPDSNSVAAYSDGAKVWDIDSGTLKFSFPERSFFARAFKISPDGRWLAISEDDKHIALIDLTSGMSGRISDNIYPTAFAFTADSKYLLSGNIDGGLRLFDIPSGTLRLTAFCAGQSTDWLVVAPDGRFDGPPAAWEQVLWRFGDDELRPVEMFFGDYFYPGLLSDTVRGKVVAIPDISTKDRRQPQLKISTDSGGANGGFIVSRQVRVLVQVEEAPQDKKNSSGSGARDVRLFRNGSLVARWHGDVLKGKPRTVLQTNITIVAGKNRLTAYAFNHDNIKSADAALTLTGARSRRHRGIAYVLAIGLDRYANSKYNLRYAVADAEIFAAQVKAALLSHKQHSEVKLALLSDNDATKANIVLALRRLAGDVNTPPVVKAPATLSPLHRAEPEDSVFIYYAGHGTVMGPRFYIIPHDLGYLGERNALDEAQLRSVIDHSISDLELDALFEHIDGKQLVLVIDACRSGQALDVEDPRQGPMNSQGLAQLAYDKGMYVLTASQGYQAALEATKYKHGLLTYALIQEGLDRSQADNAPKDGQITLREWLDYPAQEVPRLQRSLMQGAHKHHRNFGFVEGDEKIQDVEKRSLQRPRVFYRREPEEQPFVIADTGYSGRKKIQRAAARSQHR